jgi:hypothetical protein
MRLLLYKRIHCALPFARRLVSARLHSGKCPPFLQEQGRTVWEIFGEGPLGHTLVAAPQMRRLAKMLVGKWKVDEHFAPGGTLPNGGKGSGHSIIEFGPGESSPACALALTHLVGEGRKSLQDNGL